jgi:hypothetical protein
MPVRSRSFVAVRVAIPVLSVVIYLASLAAPGGYQGWLGFHLFLAGLLFSWAIHLTFSWWANVLFAIALGYYCRGVWALAANWALVATALAMSGALVDAHIINAPAFQLWAGSMATLAVGSLALARWPQQIFDRASGADRFVKGVAQACPTHPTGDDEGSSKRDSDRRSTSYTSTPRVHTNLGPCHLPPPSLFERPNHAPLRTLQS